MIGSIVMDAAISVPVPRVISSATPDGPVFENEMPVVLELTVPSLLPGSAINEIFSEVYVVVAPSWPVAVIAKYSP